MPRPALLILSGNAAASGLLFARNLTVAALIPVADYGIAATFALAMAAVEMATAFGLQQQIVQARDGDDPRLQDALAGFQLLRGALAGLALFLLAGPMAAFLAIPEAAWAYRLLALVPLLNAMQHLDIHRMNRSDRFGPLMATGTAPALLSLLLVWPLAAWLGDWRIMLGAILAQAVAAAILSHAMAERPWRPRVDRALWARTLRFGWPMLVNAVILFLVFQADKLAVGHILGMEALGVFAMGVTLTLTPSLIAGKSIQTALLPRLSARAGSAGFVPTAHAALTASMLAGLALAICGVAAGWLAAPLLAGTGYGALSILLGPLAILQGLRVAKTGSVVVALARGWTGNAALSNLPRVGALVLGIAALSAGAELTVLIWLGCLGEAVGFALSLHLVRRRDAGIAWPVHRVCLWCLGIAFAAGATFAPWLLVAALAVLSVLAMWREGER
ncbi:oligosaccharide flippase family protein [Jannaschia sp. S6380]|uniref:oligosaccharide flippase family protein n=1 Tax=Jannaschia sp. S6380 TaxID=2926408 RepID=UPI001FF267CB|nr:oligosaccharide flippase family protein [Jannaschia sp. S6380]MCK0168696.1 oligosaccharide flippase family protein [Jannaschia sp. S6380]